MFAVSCGAGHGSGYTVMCIYIAYKKTIAYIVELKGRKQIKLSDLFRVLVQRIISVNSYRKEFLLSQLMSFSFTRDLTRYSFPSKQRNSNK